MNHIRPHKVFNLLDDQDRLARISLPFQHSVTSMLERGILMSLVKVLRPGTVFEFGTYLGEMTRMFAENSEAVVYTLDLGAEHSSGLLDTHENRNLAQSLRQRKLFDDCPQRARITELLGDSTRFDFTPFHGRMEFILVDGGHHIEVVRSDTRNSLAMLSRTVPACLVWHDYLNPHYEITGFLDALSTEMTLFHVEETKYVFHLANCDALVRRLT